jgi:hypothetical protein
MKRARFAPFAARRACACASSSARASSRACPCARAPLRDGRLARDAARGRRGFAIIIVLLVLLALLVLSAPFLLASRNADRASSELADRAAARIALDAASRHARVLLGASHPSQDTTPYWDSLAECSVDNRFDPKFLDANDAHGLMWDVHVDDIAGKIDLNSASPHVIANMLGAAARFGDVIAPDSKTIPLSITSGLEPAGFLWADGELIHYKKLDQGELKDFDRGVLAPAAVKDWHGGPRPASAHDNGAPVLDQRAFAPALWRLSTADGELRRFESMEELRDAKDFVLAAATLGPAVKSRSADASANPAAADAGSRANASDRSNAAVASDTNNSAASSEDAGWGQEALRALYAHGSVFGGVRGGRVWQHAARVTSAIQAHQDGQFFVDHVRWFNAGSTIQITDGKSTELAIATVVQKTGLVVLDRVLANDYAAYSAEVRVLARRPVNINTASRDVLRILFTNLQILGRNSRITKDRAEQLADLVIQSRPFTGHEDFLRRVVLPAGGLEKLPTDAEVHPDVLASGSGFIDAYEALALYTNGLNANDASLLYSTMPYAYTSRDTYAMELRTSVNAPSGVERFSLVREEVDVVTPQQQLLALWSRQEDFDEQMRIDCEAPWWATGPSATSRWDQGAAPPSRLWSHMGTYAGKTYLPGVTDTSGMQDKESQPTAEHVFASREKDGWAQLWPSRVDEMGQRQGRVIHFDQETRDLEGRYLPDQPITRSTKDAQVNWSGGNNPCMLPISFSLWVKPRSVADSTILDVMSNVDMLSDRVSLLFEQGDLVLRVMDGVGDHPQTTEKEYGEVRYALAAGKGPGMPTDIWSHVEVMVRGNQPHQMSMLVNGLDFGVRTPGLTRLTGNVDATSPTLPVESVEGFPPYCTVRVGNELIEVTVANGALSATRQLVGQYAGFGGHVARDQYSPSDADANIWTNEHLNAINTAHPSGTPVELYGYSLPTFSNVPVGHAQLPNALGPFRVAMLSGVITPQNQNPIGESIPVGLGLPSGNGLLGRNSTATGLVLKNADQPNGNDVQFMTAFNQGGGYAAIIQYDWQHPGANPHQDLDGDPLGGVEVIRYSGYNGTTLQIAARGDAVPELTNLATGGNSQPYGFAVRRAFISTWDPHAHWPPDITGNTFMKDVLNARTYVVPISIPVPGAGPLDYLKASVPNNSQFAQLTHVQDAEHTEWLRYDYLELNYGQLVRDEPAALIRAFKTIKGGFPTDGQYPPDIGPVTMFDGGGGGQPMVTSANAPPQAGGYGNVATAAWDPRIGQSDTLPQALAPITDTVASALQFRGVFGTFTHQHPAGTLVLPVFSTRYNYVDAGRPGRLDVAFLVGATPNYDHPGWPVRVHRSHVPGTKVPRYGFTQDSLAPLPNNQTHPPLPYTLPNPQWMLQDGYLVGPARIYVALQDKSPEPMTPGGAATTNSAVVPIDTRALTRLVAFPSGERPRIVTHMSVGGGASGASAGAVPSAIVDEIVFGDSKFGRSASPAVSQGGDPEACSGACMELTADLAEAGTSMSVNQLYVRVPIGLVGNSVPILNDLRKDGGLLRAGDEIMAYSSRDPVSGTITLAPSGRGLLGTRPQTHQFGEPVEWLEHRTVTSLNGSMNAADATIPVGAIDEFPSEGTVMIGTELLHYTRVRGGVLEMPRASSVPGAMDAKGDGLFRGRYGTSVATHASGEAVIQFPFRFWDRWSPRADASELSYFAFGLEQPAGYFESFFFVKTDTEQSTLGVLERTDRNAPWDGDPEKDKRLHLYWKGDEQGGTIPIGVQSDAIDWRVFVKYASGAFDPKTGMSHGWKETPRLRQIGAFYYGPNLVLRSVER